MNRLLPPFLASTAPFYSYCSLVLFFTGPAPFFCVPAIFLVPSRVSPSADARRSCFPSRSFLFVPSPLVLWRFCFIASPGSPPSRRCLGCSEHFVLLLAPSPPRPLRFQSPPALRLSARACVRASAFFFSPSLLYNSRCCRCSGSPSHIFFFSLYTYTAPPPPPPRWRSSEYLRGWMCVDLSMCFFIRTSLYLFTNTAQKWGKGALRKRLLLDVTRFAIAHARRSLPIGPICFCPRSVSPRRRFPPSRVPRVGPRAYACVCLLWADLGWAAL